MKYYAVKRGRAPGVYETWRECWQQTTGYSGALFRSFDTREAAALFLSAEEAPESINPALPFAYIDGSHSKSAGVYSYGGFIYADGITHIIQGKGSSPEYLQYWNVTGEVRGALEVIKQAQELQISALNLFFDYAGIEKWATGEWKCKTPLAAFYRDYYQRHRVRFHFWQVKGHAGITGNELADLLAKDAAGAKLPSKKKAAQLEAFKAEGVRPDMLPELLRVE